MNNAVLVLNQNYEPLNVCNVRRAVVLVIGGKAEILEAKEIGLASANEIIPAPSVIRLMYLIRRPRPRVKLTRREIFIRDNFTCQYCGRHGHDLTVDHVIPRSRGGLHVWDNVVTACKPCNHRKGGKSPSEARMRLLSLPREPKVSPHYVFLQKLHHSPHEEWKKFLPDVTTRQ